MRFLLLLLMLWGCLDENHPQTLITDGAILVQNKSKIAKGDKKLQQAKAALIKDADLIIERHRLYTVTSKSNLPPSQSKHDYYSLAPYWWPDESKPNGLPYIRKDGQVNPESNEIMDSEQLKQISFDIHRLGFAYFYTGDEKYVEWINKLIHVFFIDESTRMTPHLRYAQLIKGRDIRGSITIGSVSFVSMIEGIQLAAEASTMNKEYLMQLKAWFKEFVHWMENEKLPKGEANIANNIGVYYTVQTVVYNLFAGNVEQAKRALETHGKAVVNKQIGSEGELKEELKRTRPLNYVRYTITAFDHLVQLSKILEVDLYHYTNPRGGSIHKMYEWLLPYARGDKKWEFSNENSSRIQFQRSLLKFRHETPMSISTESEANLPYMEILTNTIN